MDQELEAILEESRRAYEEEQELRKLVLEIEKSEEEERQQQESRQRQVALEAEEARKRKEEEEQQRIANEFQQLQIINKPQDPQEQRQEEEEENDEDYNAAIQASLTSHDREQNRHHYNQRTRQLLESLDQPPPGRFRQCIEIPKETGQLVVGVHHHHTKEIARRAGGDCKIRFLPRNISINFDGQMGDCLLIEANDPGSIEIAETWLVRRVADLFFQDTQMRSGEKSDAQVNDSKGSGVAQGQSSLQDRRQKQTEVLERFPSFQSTAGPSQQRSMPQVVSQFHPIFLIASRR
jgi:hypothetical protein